jgi:hypothetical protein
LANAAAGLSPRNFNSMALFELDRLCRPLVHRLRDALDVVVSYPSGATSSAKAVPNRGRVGGRTVAARISLISASVLRPFVAARARSARCTSWGSFLTMIVAMPLLLS